MVTVQTAALRSAREQVRHRRHGQRRGSLCSGASTNMLTTLGGKTIKGEKRRVPVSRGLSSEIFSSAVSLELDI